MILTHGTLQGEIIGFTLSLIGAAVAYLFGSRTLLSTTVRLKRLFPGHTDVFYTRVDALLVVATGAILGHYLFVHRGPIDCVTCGIGFSTALKTLLKATT